MKVGIVGAGAMGSTFAYFLHKANMETVLFVKDSTACANLKDGLNVTITDNSVNVKIPVSDQPDILQECSVVFIFVKTYDTENAMRKISSGINKNTIVVTLQNGIGNKDILAKYISADKIVYGSTSIGATKLSVNSVRLGGMGDTTIGGSKKESVSVAESVLKQAGLSVLVTDKPEETIWRKAIINAAINPLGAILGIPNGEIIKNEHSKALQEHLVKEAVETANSTGMSLNYDEMIEQTRIVCQKTANNLCSMLQDVNAKRQTEIDSINGIIIEYGRRNKIQTPYNDAVYRLIKSKELL